MTLYCCTKLTIAKNAKAATYNYNLQSNYAYAQTYAWLLKNGKFLI